MVADLSTKQPASSNQTRTFDCCRENSPVRFSVPSILSSGNQVVASLRVRMRGLLQGSLLARHSTPMMSSSRSVNTGSPMMLSSCVDTGACRFVTDPADHQVDPRPAGT